MAAMRAGDLIVPAKGGARADRGALLADGDVRRPPVIEPGERRVPARAQTDDHLLELADGEHAVQEAEGGRRRERARRQLRGHGARVAEPADGAVGVLERREVRTRVAVVATVRV